MSNLNCLYTVQITPRTDKSSLEVVFFNDDKYDKYDSSHILEFFRRNKVSEDPDIVPTKTIVFRGAEPTVSYTVKVTLILKRLVWVLVLIARMEVSHGSYLW